MNYLKSLKDLFYHELQDLYDAEQQLAVALPRMADAAHSPELKEALTDHLTATRHHLERLDKAFTELGAVKTGVTCEAMKGLIREAESIVEAHGDPNVKDAALIGAAQRIEHYEIAAYGTARTFAEELDLDDIADLLQDTLDEEGDADERLTDLAEGNWFEEGINEEAVA